MEISHHQPTQPIRMTYSTSTWLPPAKSMPYAPSLTARSQSKDGVACADISNTAIPPTLSTTFGKAISSNVCSVDSNAARQTSTYSQCSANGATSDQSSDNFKTSKTISWLCKFVVNGMEIETVPEFKYLGQWLHFDDNDITAVLQNIHHACICWNQIACLLKHQKASLKAMG